MAVRSAPSRRSAGISDPGYRATGLREEVKLDDPDTCSLRLAADQGGVLPGWKNGDKGRLQIAARLQAGSFEFCLLT